ncbi:MAG TPA: hypothetical protein VFP87_13690 [Chitinophagaceae bacterium]|nr:hypothetical protein [Chitinophagaceae bacterium]
MARGEKNKRGTFTRSGEHPKSDQNRQQTGGRLSAPQPQDLNSHVNRNIREPGPRTRSFSSNERRFNLLVDSVPYMVTAMPFRFNGETRYRVSFNGGSEHVFTWDSSLGQLRAIDDEASTLPDNLEEAISEKLQSKA